jgi:hypothetical protein
MTVCALPPQAVKAPPAAKTPTAIQIPGRQGLIGQFWQVALSRGGNRDDDCAWAVA